MYVFACEASSSTASVALLDGERLIGEFSVNAGNTHTENLLPMTNALFDAASLTVDDVGLFVLSAGPGSFTGVRIAASFIKGLAFGRDVPSVAVSTLESLAMNARGLADISLPCLDARRGQIYSAIFDISGEYPDRITPDLALPAEEMIEKVRPLIGSGKRIAVPGDGSHILNALLIREGCEPAVVPEKLKYQSAASAAALGLRRYLNGEHTDAKSLKPVYLRIPQAERDRQKKLSEEGGEGQKGSDL